MIFIRLNHCVGGRNYVAFLMCVVSAVVTAMVILVASVSELVLYYMHSNWLIIWSTSNASTTNDNNDYAIGNDTMSSSAFNETFALNDTNILSDNIFSNVTETIIDAAQTVTQAGISLHDTIFLAFISVLAILAAITVGLLLHLCFFHVYISFLGLTTYEYIRNQRINAATQTTNGEAKATPEAALNALKKSSMTQLFFCSTIDPKNLLENHNDIKYEPKSIHCCIQSAPYIRSSHKALYICSMLHERIVDENAIEEQQILTNRVFHCCSQFRQIVKLPPEQSDSSITGNAPPDEMVQLSEQCTFCSFKMKPKNTNTIQSPERCCAKMHSKHHRWRRKWNCCSAVPDSPDDSNDTLRSVSGTMEQSRHMSHMNNHHRHHHHHHQRNGECVDKNVAKISNHLRPSMNGSNSTKPNSSNAKNNISRRPSLATNLKSNSRPRLMRPLARVRHILRILSQRRHGDTSDGNSSSGTEYPDTVAPIPSSIKINQVRPITLTEEMLHQKSNSRIQSIPSAINGDGDDNKDILRNNLSVPALPPPTRRKICASPDLDELAEAISFVQNTHFVQTSPTSTKIGTSRPFPSINRRRRKNLLRNRSPTLSPIHESEYSNPASPQPCRHNSNSDNSISNTSTPKMMRTTTNRNNNNRNY